MVLGVGFKYISFSLYLLISFRISLFIDEEKKKKYLFFSILSFFFFFHCILSLIFIWEWSFIVGHLFPVQKHHRLLLSLSLSLSLSSLSLSLSFSLCYCILDSQFPFIHFLHSLVPFLSFFFCNFSLWKTKEKAMCFYY